MDLFKYIFFAILAFGLLVAVIARPQGEYGEDDDDDDDQYHAASGHDHLGRVQIKVYRGPTEYDGHKKFAPWGFWVKQPADEETHH